MAHRVRRGREPDAQSTVAELGFSFRHPVGQLIDGDHTVLAEVERLAKIGTHQPVNASHAVIDIAK